MTALDRIGANRVKRARAADRVTELDTELTELVKAAFAEGFTATQIAPLLGVKPARVYQIRDGRR